MASCASTGGVARGERLDELTRSDNWSASDERFVNLIPMQEFDFWASIGKLFHGVEHPTPEGDLPVVARRAQDFAQPPASGLRVTWLGHASSLIEIDGVRVLLDPVWAERASPFQWAGPSRFHAPPLPLEELLALELDAVAISHDHYDHLDHRLIEALRDQVPRFVVPLGVGVHLEAWGVAPERITELDWWGEARLGEVRLVATPARHFTSRSLVMANRDRVLWSGWALVGPRHRVFYSGDGGLFPGFKEIGARLGPFDVTLMEVGAYDELWPDYHLGPEQAVQAHRMVRGGLFVPVHWGTFNLANHGWTEPVERALVAAEEHGVTVAVPRPGASLEPATPPALARWWPELPWRSGAEDPIVSSGLDQDKTSTRPGS